MKTVGLIVEYNPLHNGHVHHFREAKRMAGAEAAIAVMSGDWLQRGEPAVVGKWARAEMALRMGVDVVLELPVAYSAHAAEWFAYGAVSALHATGVVDSLCFGAESGEPAASGDLLRALADEPEPFRQLVREALKAGASYPAAYAQAVQRFGGAGQSELPLGQPNDILGLHYRLALQRLGSRIEPLAIPRIKAGYHEREAADSAMASATAVRRLIAGGGAEAARPYLPPGAHEVLRRELAAGRGPIGWESFAQPLLRTVISLPAAELAALAEVTEGLEHRLKSRLAAFPPGEPITIERYLDLLKTKRYTRAKLQRMLVRVLLQHSKAELARDSLQAGVPYLRVLGFSERGRALLKEMKRTAGVPVYTKLPAELPPMLERDVQASMLYALAYRQPAQEQLLRDYYQPPLRFEADPGS